jgi:hypothetical protein
MPATYEKIQSTTITGSATSSVDFTSISSAYTDIVLVFYCKSNSTNNPTLRLTFNGSSTGYSGRQMYGSATTPVSNNNTNASFISIARAAGMPSVANETALVLLHIMDYASTNKYKSVFAQVNSYENGGELDIGVWANNAAINRITIDTPTSNDFAVGSVMTLYGIKAA